MTVLSHADTKRVEAAIAELESKSAAEFVVAVVPRSHSYAGLRAIYAAGWALAAATMHLEFALGSPLLIVPLELIVGALVWFALAWPPLFRRLIPRAAADKAVAARALQLFAERGVHHTRDRTGVLLLLSELEHKAIILGDAGIDKSVGADGWQRYIARVVAGLRSGAAADGILEVLRELEGQLARVAPLRPGDVDELPNTVVRAH